MMRRFFLTLVRILTGRLAFERRARMIALQMGHEVGGHDYMHSLAVAEQFQYFMLTGERYREVRK